MALWILGCISNPTKAGTYKNFLFKNNSLTFSSSDIKILGKVLSIVKLVNLNITHYLVKSSKDVDLWVFGITSFFFSKVIKRFCLTVEPLISTKDQFFLAAGHLVSMI